MSHPKYDDEFKRALLHSTKAANLKAKSAKTTKYLFLPFPDGLNFTSKLKLMMTLFYLPNRLKNCKNAMLNLRMMHYRNYRH